MAELRQYKVIAGSCGGRGRLIFKSGDTVNEANFLPGHAEMLVEKGFLKRLDETVTGEINDFSSDERQTEIVPRGESIELKTVPEKQKDEIKKKKSKDKNKN